MSKMASAKILRFGQHIKELRLHLCQKSAASKGARDFVENHYVPMKKSNPKFPILIRECSGVQPTAWARYEYGKETSVSLSNMDGDQVLQAIQTMAAK